MSDNKEAFLDKVKKMPMEELVKYKNTAITMNRFINIFGISCCLLMVFFPVLITVMIGVPSVCFLANIGAGIGKSLEEIRRNMEKFQKT